MFAAVTSFDEAKTTIHNDGKPLAKDNIMSEKIDAWKKHQETAAKLMQEAKDEVVSKLVEGLDGLSKVIEQLKELAPAHKVTEMTEWRKLADKLNLTILKVPAKAKSAKAPKARKAKGVRTSKITDEEILTFAATERPTKDFVAKFGQLIPKRLKTLKASKKLTMRKDGLKKLWKAGK